MKKIIVIIILIAIGLLYYFFFYNRDNPQIDLNVNLKQNDRSDLIVISSPIRNAEVSSPLRISGRARGVWYFEGSFPVELVDEYGNTIAMGSVASQGEWMTEEFVPFLGSLRFNNYIKGKPGKLILRKSNPSGLEENDDQVEVPVIFK